MTSLTPTVEKLLAPPDRIRGLALRALGPWARTLVVPRETRVAFTGSALILSALALAGTVPLWVIAFGPILWGVPHVLADVRYLVVVPGQHRHRLRVALVAAGMASAAFGLGVRGGLLCAAGALVTARGTWGRKAIGLGALAGLFALAQRDPYRADLWSVQLHNAAGVLIWLVWRRRDRRIHYVPAALFAAGVVALLAGAFDPMLGEASRWLAPARGFDVRTLVPTMAPCGGPVLAARWVLVYAFGQSVHYVVWLRLVPDETRKQHTPRSFVQSYRALCRDLGTWMVALAAVAAVVLVAWAFVDLAGARENYLKAAFFHVYLEMAALALWFGESRRA